MSKPQIDCEMKVRTSNSPDKVEYGVTVIAEFDVTVNENTDGLTIVNDAAVTVDDYDPIITNEVTNQVPGDTEEPNPGKVIVETDENGNVTETNKNSVNYGDTVSFQLSVDSVNIVKDETSGENVQVTNYYMYDKLDPGFTLDTSSFDLWIIDDTGTYSVSSFTADDDTSEAGVVTYNGTVASKGAVTVYVYETNEYTLIMVDIDWVNANGAYYGDGKIYFTYDTTLNTDAVIATTGNWNYAIFDYSTKADDNPYEPNPDNPEYPDGSQLNHGSDEITTVTYTFALGIQKYDSETGEPLEGATFTLKEPQAQRSHRVRQRHRLHWQLIYRAQHPAIPRERR